jgi:hypothetical protein
MIAPAAPRSAASAYSGPAAAACSSSAASAPAREGQQARDAACICDVARVPAGCEVAQPLGGRDLLVDRLRGRVQQGAQFTCRETVCNLFQGGAEREGEGGSREADELGGAIGCV